MDCPYCNNKLVKRKDEVEFKSRSLGKVMVPNIQFLECSNCDEKLVGLEEGDKAISYIEREEQKAISKLPIGEFVTAKEATEILGITKQAFSKNHKIKQGLIYSAKIGGRKYYHRKSVELFKEKNNGKFLLPRQDQPLIYVKTVFIDDMPMRYRNVITPKEIAPPPTFVIHAQKDVKSRHSEWVQLISPAKKGIHDVYK